MASRATPLRNALKAQFYPLVEQKGFLRDKTSNPLFIGFRRQRNGRVHLFDIQWDKYHRPSFVLNFGEAPAGDLEFHGTVVRSSEVGPQHCPQGGRLQRSRGGSLGCWFRLRRPWRGILATGRLHYSPAEVVAELTLAFAELEEWWQSGAEGPHVYVWRRIALTS